MKHTPDMPDMRPAWEAPWPAPLAALIERLTHELKQAAPLAVAFSGGMDSAFLLAAATVLHDQLRWPKPLALTVVSPLIPQEDLACARALASALPVEYHELTPDPLRLPAVRNNQADRCYHCKHLLFSSMREEARCLGATLIDGTHAEDRPEERPGMRALEELGISSPLREAGFAKADIRAAMQHLGLTRWIRPPSSCLATRFPCGATLHPDHLRAVDRAEEKLRELGFRQCRVRITKNGPRIEVPPEDADRLHDPSISNAIAECLRPVSPLT